MWRALSHAAWLASVAASYLKRHREQCSYWLRAFKRQDFNEKTELRGKRFSLSVWEECVFVLLLSVQRSVLFFRCLCNSSSSSSTDAIYWLPSEKNALRSLFSVCQRREYSRQPDQQNGVGQRKHGEKKVYFSLIYSVFWLLACRNLWRPFCPSSASSVSCSLF